MEGVPYGFLISMSLQLMVILQGLLKITNRLTIMLSCIAIPEEKISSEGIWEIKNSIKSIEIR